MTQKKKEMNTEEEDFDLDFGKAKKGDKVVPVKLTANSRLKFRCHKGVRCFTACCSNVNIVLPPYDLLRIRKRLGITTEEVFEKYASVEILAKTLLPSAVTIPWAWPPFARRTPRAARTSSIS